MGALWKRLLIELVMCEGGEGFMKCINLREKTKGEIGFQDFLGYKVIFII